MPSLLAIVLALVTRNVFLSLFSGIVVGVLILNNFSIIESLIGLVELFLSLLSQGWILKTLAFIVLVGSIMSLIDKSGGIAGFVEWIENKKHFVNSKRTALLLSYIMGVVIFVETSITALIAGAVGKSFYKQYDISPAKLAFVCDSTSAPISSLIVLNGYGALLLGLITTQILTGVISGDAFDILIHSLVYNIYAIITLMIVFISIWYDIDFGPMKNSKYIKLDVDLSFDKMGSKYFMILPLILMILLVFVFLYITGDGDILKGSGSSAVFYTTFSTIIFIYIYYIFAKVMDTKVFIKMVYKGSLNLVPIAFVMLAAFGIGEVTSELKTGEYLAVFASANVNIYFLAPIIFLLSSIMAFATGTSWGTFSIMIPIAIPISVALGADTSLVLGAVISGAIFGDHTSPISDTTIISSLAADCDVVEHVKTQLPYALLSAFISLVLFFLLSVI